MQVKSTTVSWQRAQWRPVAVAVMAAQLSEQGWGRRIVVSGMG
jgi:hypothetical protein